jgi:hypothetical protein
LARGQLEAIDSDEGQHRRQCSSFVALHKGLGFRYPDCKHGGLRGEISRLVMSVIQRAGQSTLQSVWIAKLVARLGKRAPADLGIETEDILDL